MLGQGLFLDFRWICCCQMTVLYLYFGLWAWTDINLIRARNGDHGISTQLINPLFTAPVEALVRPQKGCSPSLWMHALYRQHQGKTERQIPAAGRKCEIHQEKKVIFEFTSKTLTLEKRIQLFDMYYTISLKYSWGCNTNQTLKTLITSNISNI